MFERNELIGIIKRAEDAAYGAGVTPCWRRAYLALADAADHLDAMTARCGVPHPTSLGTPPDDGTGTAVK